MNGKAVVVVVVAAVVLWFAWQPILAVVIGVLAFGATILLYELAPTLVIALVVVIVGGLWTIGKWRFDTVRGTDRAD